MDPVQRARYILSVLACLYGKPKTELKYQTPFQLLAATILSAQTTDKQVNQVTPKLFKRFADPQDFLTASLKDVEQAINSIGLFRTKAKNIIGAAKIFVENFQGKMPRTMDEMIKLPGVGRKTANVVLGELYNIKAGVCVDTHVARLSQRLGLSRQESPIKIEKDLMELIPKKDWRLITHCLINHGRRVCTARKPNCEICPIRKYCDYGAPL